MPERIHTDGKADDRAAAAGGQRLGESIASELQPTPLAHENEWATIDLEVQGAQAARVELGRLLPGAAHP